MESDSYKIIKSTLKALIISAPNNLSIQQLNRDYHETEGEDIPYRKMGFNSLESFLLSMPETVQMCRIGNMVFVKNVSNAKTSHIEQFVRDQRKNTRRGNNNRRNNPQRARPILQQNYRNLVNPYIPNTYSRNFDLYMSASFARVNTLGLQHNKYSNIHQQANFNVQLPSQIPRQSGAHMQQVQRQHVHMQQPHRQQAQSHVTNTISKGFQQNRKVPCQAKENSVIKQQTQSKVNNFCKEANSRTLPPPAPISTLPLPLKTEQMRRQSIIATPRTEQTRRQSIIEAPKTVIVTPRTEQTPRESVIVPPKTEQTRRESINEAPKTEQTRRQSVIVTRRTEQTRRESIIAAQTEQNHKESINKSQETQPKHHGFTTAKQQTHYKVAKENGEKSHDNSKSYKHTNQTPSASQSQQTQQMSISQTAGAEKCDQRNDKENAMNQVNLSMKNLTLTTTLSKDTQDVYEVLDTPQRKPLNRTNGIHNESLRKSQLKSICVTANEYDNDYDDAVPSFALTANIFEIDYPDNVAPFGMRFKLQNLPIVNSIIAVYITKIVSPEQFYYHIGNDIEKFEFLCSDIQCFYESIYDQEYRVPPQCIREGQICAASIHGTWHRAIIRDTINLKPDDVKVHLVDSGYDVVLGHHEIKFLLRYFADLPIRVLNGRLANLKPTNDDGKWSRESVQHFQKLTFDRILYGKVTAVEKQEMRSSIILCDTNENGPKNINTILINEGYAVKRVPRFNF